MSNPTQRGQFHAFEVTLVFLAWMVLLASTWSHSAAVLSQQENQFLREKAFARAQAQAATLIEQHHVNPWNGCAIFDAAKKRTRVHVIAKSCLHQLSTRPPTPLVQEVYLRTQNGKEIFFEQPSNEHHCIAIERMIRVNETNEITLLGVISCAE